MSNPAFRFPSLRVRLIETPANPFDLSIGAARTCYSGKGPVFPEDVRKTEEARNLRNRIARSTLKAGHLTTRQHAHFVFVLEGVSRHAVWSFFHSHPHFNSEQVSQRYVAVREGEFYLPPSLKDGSRATDTQKPGVLLEIYERIHTLTRGLYTELTDLLQNPAGERFFQLYPGRKRKPEKWSGAIRKRAMEAARYILPVSTLTCPYHTVDGLTLHRYAKMVESSDVSPEVREIVGRMLEEVRRIDPLFSSEFPAPLFPGDLPEARAGARDPEGKWILDPAEARKFVDDFDRKLDGKIARLLPVAPDQRELLEEALKSIFGRVSVHDREILDLLFDAKSNTHFHSLLNEGIHARNHSVLAHVNLTFRKKISHTADSQNQRHRLVYGSRPFPMLHYTGQPDYITPELIRETPDAFRLYREGMEQIFQGMEDFLAAGGDASEAVYLLPNAFPIRFFETGNLSALRHKWMARSCYNAQEEIFHATLEEILEAEQTFPFLQGVFRPPCTLRYRSGVAPHCPEGDRFCGVRVWEKEIQEYRRIL